MARFIPKKTLQNICSYKLNETYDTLYELQQRLEISDDYLLNTSRDFNKNLDNLHLENLRQLLDASKVARDNLTTWYYKSNMVELNVTISLLSAKIKFMEYKFGLCEGLDLHQACSLSLIDFCNILSEKTVHTANPGKIKRKTMHEVSNEVRVPVWLSQYRNQICHVPSESPCIAILVPLVVKSLEFLKESFWAQVLHQESFNAGRCTRLIKLISRFTHITSRNQHKEVKKDIVLSKTRLKRLQKHLGTCEKACLILKKLLIKNPDPVIDLIIEFISQSPPKSDERNCGLLLEQVILAHQFERFVFRLLKRAKDNTDYNIMVWLRRIIYLVAWDRPTDVKRRLEQLEMNLSVKLRRLTKIPPLKCCHIAYQLMEIDHHFARDSILSLEPKLSKIMGPNRASLFVKLTKLARCKFCL